MKKIIEFVKSHHTKIIAILIIITLLRETGLMDFNYYKCITTSSRGGSYLDIADQNYLINIYNDDKLIEVIERKTNDNKKQVVVNAFIKKLRFKGNYFLPLYKKFNVTYEREHHWHGKGYIQGSIDKEIIGICSIRNAKEVVMQEILADLRKLHFNNTDQGN